MIIRLPRRPALLQVARYFLLLIPLFAAEASSVAQNATDPTSTAQSTALSPLTLSDRVFISSKILASLSYFAHWQDVPNLDVDSAYREYLDKAITNQDRIAFSRASMEFLAKFNNSHTVYIDRSLLQQGGLLPFLAQSIHGQWVVTESFSEGVHPGDVIETIDGEPFDQFVSRCVKLISASREAGARRVLFAREPTVSFYAHLFPERFSLVLAGGRTVEVDRRAAKNALQTAVAGRWLEPGKVAYIRIPSFYEEKNQKQAVALVHEYASAELLIVDVRNNPGGHTPNELIEALMDRPYPWWIESTPVSMPYFHIRANQGEWQMEAFRQPYLAWPSKTQQPIKEHFAGKLALLVDAGCYSACEDFAMPFKESHRALLVGETTGGSSGQPYMLDLGKGLVVLVGAKREMFSDGSPFEGVGIKPDVEVLPSAEALRVGRDTALEAARQQGGALARCRYSM